jgi:type IV secretion system protein VirB10
VVTCHHDAAGAPQLLQTSGGRGNSLDQFNGNAQEDRWRLDSRPAVPRSPYELRAGFVLPATLKT